MDTIIKQAATLPMLSGFRYIVDDGDCQDHGYLLTKQQSGTFKSVCNCGVELVDVSSADLLSILDGVSADQQALFASAK